MAPEVIDADWLRGPDAGGEELVLLGAFVEPDLVFRSVLDVGQALVELVTSFHSH